MSNKLSEDETGLFLGSLLIALLAGLLLASMLFGFKTGPLHAGTSTILLGVYIMTFGSMYLFSFKYSHKTFLFRVLIWTCENWSYPKERRMALFYGALGLLIGGVTMLTGFGLIV